MTAIKNNALFEKNFNKIEDSTIAKFGTRERLLEFLEYVSKSCNVTGAAKQSKLPQPLLAARIIKGDIHLAKCVAMALQVAIEQAEGILYDRAINGYLEVTYDKEGKIIASKRKYCSKSLLEYLKANSGKYRSKDRNKADGDNSNKGNSNNRGSDAIDTEYGRNAIESSRTFEVESYSVGSSE